VIDEWHNVFVVLGSSSAALIGLLFVSASLHLREIVNDEIYNTRAQYSMLLLAGAMVQAVAVLTPQPLWLLGTELVIVNLLSLSIPVGLLFRAFAVRTRIRGGFSPYRAVFYAACYLIGIAGGMALFMQAKWGLYLVTAGCLGSVLVIIWNAWHIMLGIGRNGRKRAR